MDAVEYSFFGGGKRFRPLLCHAVAEAFKLSSEKINGFALAVECVHTYSLIHDDLPCMDDDDMRRGKPALHKNSLKIWHCWQGTPCSRKALPFSPGFILINAGNLLKDWLGPVDLLA